jgi:hypothetical protein
MLKKIILIIIASVIIVTNIQIASGYAIPDEYKPVNTPFSDMKFSGEDSSRPENTTNTVLQIIAGTLLYFAAPIAVFSIAQASFMITMSGAETERLESGKKHLTWAVIGLLAIIFSYSIVKIIIKFVIDVGNYSAT